MNSNKPGTVVENRDGFDESEWGFKTNQVKQSKPQSVKGEVVPWQSFWEQGGSTGWKPGSAYLSGSFK